MSDTRQPHAAPLELKPLSPVLGAEILGLDLGRTLQARMFDAITQALLDYQVLVFRDQDLTEAQQIAFSRRFGEVQVNPSGVGSKGNVAPETYLLTNLDEGGNPSGEHPDRGTLVWHTDGSWLAVPGKFTMLFGIEVPSEGGETMFASMYAAYDGLTPEENDRLSRLRAVHSIDYTRRRAGAAILPTEEQKRAAPPVAHPIIRPHPETGRACVYLGEHASHIEGVDYDPGHAMVEAINRQVTAPEFVYRHRWRKGDLVMWDNRCILHRAAEFDLARERRVIRRTSVLGEAPV